MIIFQNKSSTYQTRVFSELLSHYLFKDRFGRLGKGNDKGKVEGMVGYTRRNFMVPKPRLASFEDTLMNIWQNNAASGWTMSYMVTQRRLSTYYPLASLWGLVSNLSD